MPFSIARDGATFVVAIENALVAENRAQLKALVGAELDKGGRHFVVDFRDASYLDSPALGALVSVGRTIRDRGGDIRITNLNHDLRTLFELTKLDLLFTVDDAGGEGTAGQPARVTPPSAPLVGEEREPEPPR